MPNASDVAYRWQGSLPKAAHGCCYALARTSLGELMLPETHNLTYILFTLLCSCEHYKGGLSVT